MTPIAYIRTNVFQMTQAAFAELLGVSQPTVSEMEARDSIPRHHQKRIREEAMARKLAWDDSLFFEVPRAAS